jgi:hypothetical protein
MSRLRACFVSLAVLLIAAAAVPAHAQQKLPDGTLYTLYSNVMSSQVNWVTCGSLPQSSGCYGSGHLGTFTNACPVVQSVPAALNLNTVVRYIYVLDSGSGASGMSLFAFKRTDTVSQSQDTINITQVASVPLPALVGGLGVSCTPWATPACSREALPRSPPTAMAMSSSTRIRTAVTVTRFMDRTGRCKAMVAEPTT